jgi:hypothetical protein
VHADLADVEACQVAKEAKNDGHVIRAQRAQA